MSKETEKKTKEPSKKTKKVKENEVAENVVVKEALTEVEPVKVANNVPVLETIGIEELIAYEKAASIVCKKYEIKARLSDSDNVIFRRYMEMYNIIVNELEKRFNRIVSDITI